MSSTAKMEPKFSKYAIEAILEHGEELIYAG